MVAKTYIRTQNQTHKNDVPSKVLCRFKNAISLIIKQLCCIYVILLIENINVIPNKMRNPLRKTQREFG